VSLVDDGTLSKSCFTCDDASMVVTSDTGFSKLCLVCEQMTLAVVDDDEGLSKLWLSCNDVSLVVFNVANRLCLARDVVSIVDKLCLDCASLPLEVVDDDKGSSKLWAACIDVSLVEFNDVNKLCLASNCASLVAVVDIEGFNTSCLIDKDAPMSSILFNDVVLNKLCLASKLCLGCNGVSMVVTNDEECNNL